MFHFLYISIILDIFYCFGMKDIAKEQLNVNEIGKMREQIVRFRKLKVDFLLFLVFYLLSDLQI